MLFRSELPAQRGRWIEAQDMVMYKLHMRGFTMQHGFKNSEKGTDAGILAGLSYLQKLGITSLDRLGNEILALS